LRYSNPAAPWEGSFEADSDEEATLKQIQMNCDYWHSDRCKLDTVTKYLENKGIRDPEGIIEKLIKRGKLKYPRKGYVSICRL
jgi:hypothetical protein